MDKKGQVTIFIILGIVVVVAVVFGIALRKDIAKGVAGLESRLTSSFQDEVNAVQAHVEECLEKALKEARSLPRLRNTYLNEEQYNSELAETVAGRMEACINFRQFSDLTIKRGEDLGIEVSTNTARTVRYAVARMDVSIDKGEDHASFSEFKVSLNLVGE